MLGVAQSTLRRWESLGRIPKAEWDSAGRRVYQAVDVGRSGLSGVSGHLELFLPVTAKQIPWTSAEPGWNAVETRAGGSGTLERQTGGCS